MSRTSSMGLHSSFPESANIEYKLVSRIIIRLLSFEGARCHPGASGNRAALKSMRVRKPSHGESHESCAGPVWLQPLLLRDRGAPVSDVLLSRVSSQSLLSYPDLAL